MYGWESICVFRLLISVNLRDWIELFCYSKLHIAHWTSELNTAFPLENTTYLIPKRKKTIFFPFCPLQSSEINDFIEVKLANAHGEKHSEILDEPICSPHWPAWSEIAKELKWPTFNNL